jgi:ferrous iron transport protein B
MELPPYRMPTARGTFLHMWERGWLFLKKAGTLVLGISIVMWALLTFPRNVETSQDFEAAIVAVKHQNLPEEQAEEHIEEIERAREAERLSKSLAGRIGHGIEPIIKPLGFDWRIGTALIGAFAAKEVFVAQLGIVYSIGEADEESVPLRDKLRENYSPLIGFCIMLFCLISAPCMATIAVTKRESNSWKWALFQLGGLTALAYVITLVVYQIGTLAGIGA